MTIQMRMTLEEVLVRHLASKELSYPREYGPNGSTLYLRSRSDYNVLPHKCGGWAVPDMGAMGISERAWEGGVAMSRYAFSRDRASRPWPTAAVTGHPLGGGASKSAAGGRMDISREIANGMATMSRLRIITDVTGWNSSEQGRVEPNPACFSGDGTNERCPTLEETVSRTRHTNSTIVHGTINPAGQHRLDDP